jgi:glutathione S-transferase
MLTLFQVPRGEWNIPSISPACAKLETWLRLTQIPYQVGPWPAAVAPPKGKWPYIEDDGVVLGDSTLIIEHLKRTRGVDPDAKLTPVERAIGVAFRRMIKENINWAVAQIRYLEPDGWRTFYNALAPLAAPLVGGDPQKIEEFQQGLKQTVLGQMNGHGIGRHSNEDIYQIANADLAAISDFLGDKPFFFGDQPTGADATVFGYVTNIVDVPIDAPIPRFSRSRQNLVEYCQRMRARFFSELSPT